MKNAVFWGLIMLVGVCVGTLLPAQSVDTKGQTLREIVRFDLPGPPGKCFDYLTIDGMDHWLLSAPPITRSNLLIRPQDEQGCRYHRRHARRGRHRIRS